jgi:hypothetical protein
MTKRLYKAVSLLVVGALVIDRPAEGQGGGRSAPQRDSAWIEINQANRTGVLRLLPAGTANPTDSAIIEHEGEVRLPIRRRTPIQIVNTNSALYTCTIAQTRSSVPEIEQAKAFFSAFGPYLTDVAFLSSLGAESFLGTDTAVALPNPALGIARELVEARLGSVRTAAEHANHTRILTLRALEDMRLGGTAEEAARKLQESLTCPTCPPQTFVGDMINGLGALLPATEALEAVMREPGMEPDQRTIQVAGEARKIVDGADAILAAVYGTRRLADTVSAARSVIDCDRVEVTATRGRDLVITIAPRPLPEIQRIASAPSFEFKAKALPRFTIAPAVGLSVLYAPSAAYDKFTTIKAPGDSAEIIQSGSQNSRLSYGLTLGARLDGLLRYRRLSFYLPEVTINPSENVRAIGLGGSVAISAFKVGGGALWTRHAVLQNQHVGQRLRDAAFLDTEERYGAPRGYLSFSVVGWPPFLGGQKAAEK